jgi:hypothetical protein
MANCAFGWPIYSDEGVLYTPTFSGGSWSASLPVTNVADRRLSRVARSSNALAASTQFEVDLKTARDVGLVALLLPNISSVGTVRVRASNSAGSFGSPVYDSGTVTVWPAGETAETMEGLTPVFVDLLTLSSACRYWLVEITDTANTAGYLEVARLVLAKAWQPSRNMAYGARLPLETETERMVTDGASAVYNERPTRRSYEFDLALLPEAEIMDSGFELQRIAGTSRQIFFVFDPDDTGKRMQQRAFLSVLRALTAVDFVSYDMHSMPFQLVEEL